MSKIKFTKEDEQRQLEFLLDDHDCESVSELLDLESWREQD